MPDAIHRLGIGVAHLMERRRDHLCVRSGIEEQFHVLERLHPGPERCVRQRAVEELLHVPREEWRQDHGNEQRSADVIAGLVRHRAHLLIAVHTADGQVLLRLRVRQPLELLPGQQTTPPREPKSSRARLLRPISVSM